MRIGGFQKLTLLDYPDHLAALVFTIGCDLRCPYCHNASLVVPSSSVEMVDEVTILDYLHKRQGVLEGVVISGGEPLMQSDLPDFIRKIKALGYLVKLDTNGSYPLKLKELMDLQLVDYVAVDIKQSRNNYGKAIGLDGSTIVERIDQTISILENSTISHEYRTTLVQGIHTYQDLDDILHWLPAQCHYYLQSYTDSGSILDPKGLSSFDPTTLTTWCNHAKTLIPSTTLRI